MINLIDVCFHLSLSLDIRALRAPYSFTAVRRSAHISTGSHHYTQNNDMEWILQSRDEMFH